MPNYLVSLPESATYGNLGEAATNMVIFAADAAGARRAAAGKFDGDGNELWNTAASVTELVVGAALADSGDEDWSMYAHISAGAAQTVDPLVVTADGKTRNQAQGILGADRLHIGSIALNDGGVATYVIDDILTAAGGTFTRAATFRVITVSTGVITAVELVDPGEYTVLPATMTANPVTGGGGTGALIDLTAAAVNSYESLLAQMVTNLNAQTDIANAALDLSEGASGARLLTLASIADGIGDATVVFEVRHNGTPETVLVSTITDGGIAAAVLTMAIPASPIAPPRILTFK
jgi:hypothetical protein